MNILTVVKNGAANTWKLFLKQSLLIKLLIIVVIGGISFGGYQLFGTKKQTPRFQTAKVERGTLVVSVSGSGQVSTANSASINTQSTGVVTKLYVKNGDYVNQGDPIVDIQLDEDSNQKYLAALASYQNAKNAVDAANATNYTLQSDMFNNWNTFMNLAQNSTYTNSDGSPNNTNRTLPEFIQAQDNWLASEAKYKNQQSVISQAQTALSSAWKSYQQTSPTLYAPISGTVTGLSLQEGTVISSSGSGSSSSSSSTSTSQKVASIVTNAMPTIAINLSEVDAPKVKIGQRATITFDSITDKTFTGQVISVDTVGTVNSGVTSYPVVIRLDVDSPNILSNMNATANIISQTKNDVLLVPTTAIQTLNGTSYVRVMKDGKITQTPVETGAASDTQTEITSGLSEGDTIVTSVSNTSTRTGTGQTTSPFGGTFGNRGFGGGGFGGAVRINRAQ